MEGLFVFFWFAVFFFVAYKLGRRKGRRAEARPALREPEVLP